MSEDLWDPLAPFEASRPLPPGDEQSQAKLTFLAEALAKLDQLAGRAGREDARHPAATAHPSKAIPERLRDPFAAYEAAQLLPPDEGESDAELIPLADALAKLDDLAARSAMERTNPLAAAPELPEGPPGVEIVVFPSRGFQTTLFDVLREAAEQFDSCLLISATLPYKHLVSKGAAVGLDLATFRVIDMISAVDRNGFHDSGRVAYVPSPTLLEKAILFAMEAVHDAGEGRHCLIVDSMSTLGFYNSDVALEQFTHRLTSMARMADWGARFLMNDHPKNQELLEQVAHLFDGVSAFKRPDTPDPSPLAGGSEQRSFPLSD